MPGRVDQVREDPVLVLGLATRLLLGFDANVQPLHEVAVGDRRLPEIAEPAHVNVAGPRARAEDLRGLAQGVGDAHLPGEPVTGPAGQDAHRCPASRIDSRSHERIRDLVLRPVPAVAGHEVHPVLDGLPGLG